MSRCQAKDQGGAGNERASVLTSSLLPTTDEEDEEDEAEFDPPLEPSEPSRIKTRGATGPEAMASCGNACHAVVWVVDRGK